MDLKPLGRCAKYSNFTNNGFICTKLVLAKSMILEKKGSEGEIYRNRRLSEESLDVTPAMHVSATFM